ncbi:NADH-quinone oxidoreductase subunit C [Herminiimonas sp. CN]|uniref:hydrogenase large subunit n=1 Tax=Herminiimonas sp. CN TaxID=1349818 RepID=UPI0004741457|nr:NADH-quinone oxidoreductase subunit C [Herminiimonas sp. CN]
MKTDALFERYALPLRPLPGGAPAWLAEAGAQDWRRIARIIRTEGGRLISVWGTDRTPEADQFIISAAYCVAEGLLWLQLPVTEQEGYPDLSEVFPAAVRMQRAIFDLLGIRASGAEDVRPWLNHGKWPQDYFPLRQQHSGLEQFDSALESYPFVSVAGDGVHEIAVGPIHAGTIEPGHFRFSVVGEKVLRLEQRFGYTHKGTDKLFTRHHMADGYRIAGRVSGDSTVAFAWAYCMAVEAATASQIPPRAQWLRALLLERERIANHLGDLGALGNDAGLAMGLAQFSLLKEQWVRLNDQLFGHRFMMDRIVPGGTVIDLDASGISLLVAQCAQIETEVRALRVIYEEHAGLQDRFISAGRVLPKLAAELGLCGLAGRASAQAWDARADQPINPYAQLNVRMATHSNGDVAARVFVRFEEIFESMRLLREIAHQLPPGPTTAPLSEHHAEGLGLGWVEGWRGPVLVAMESDAQGKILRCHCHEPSWQNWPILQHAIMGNIVPDFPLINKSFNLSYSGHDL